MGCEASAAEPIDRAHLARFTLGNATLEREILQLFAEQLPIYIEQLRSADSQQDWKLAAHTIKGSALAVGGRRLASAAQMAECVTFEATTDARQALRRQALHAVVEAAEEASSYITCLFATP